MLLHDQLGIQQVRISLPFRLNHVNCHAIKGSAGWDLIDTGLSKESTYEEWLQFFTEQSIKPADIKGIYVTHFHPDHYGCSGWLQKYSGAPVYIGAIDDRIVTRYWKNGDYILRAMTGLFEDNGMPEEVIRKAVSSLGNMIPYTQPPAAMTPLQAGQTVILGDYEYRVLVTPGHSDGHICFYNQEEKVLISGDHLLPEITSCISRWPQPGMELNPLDNFLRSIDSIRSFNCKLALPAHGKPFTNIEERIRQLENHHKERLALIKNSTAGGANAYQVCRQVFSQDLSDHEIRFAFTETLAHLVYLVYRGELRVVTTDGIDIYSQRGA
ncbi:MAG TPA: MBL fold metallo-hydrolase [Desulfitobacteriaceae bacterium]|nr:MBL fold metallo-hydrolase [Desulfitobacteriaceae bacterium]